MRRLGERKTNCLQLLQSNPDGLVPTEISALLGLTLQQTVDLLDALEARGWARPEPFDGHGVPRWRLTKKGYGLLDLMNQSDH